MDVKNFNYDNNLFTNINQTAIELLQYESGTINVYQNNVLYKDMLKGLSETRDLLTVYSLELFVNNSFFSNFNYFISDLITIYGVVPFLDQLNIFCELRNINNYLIENPNNNLSLFGIDKYKTINNIYIPDNLYNEINESITYLNL